MSHRDAEAVSLSSRDHMAPCVFYIHVSMCKGACHLASVSLSKHTYGSPSSNLFHKYRPFFLWKNNCLMVEKIGGYIISNSKQNKR